MKDSYTISCHSIQHPNNITEVLLKIKRFFYFLQISFQNNFWALNMSVIWLLKLNRKPRSEEPGSVLGLHVRKPSSACRMASGFRIWAASWQNQQNDIWAQRRLGSAWASAQPNHSLRYLHEETLRPQLPIEHGAKTLISLGGCQGWSESALGTQVILLVLSWGGSFCIWLACL